MTVKPGDGLHANAQLEGLALSTRAVVVVGLWDLGWCLVFWQPERPAVAVGVAPGLWQDLGGEEQGETQVAGVSKHEYLWDDSQ